MCKRISGLFTMHIFPEGSLLILDLKLIFLKCPENDKKIEL